MGIGPSTKETSLHHFRDPLWKSYLRIQIWIFWTYYSRDAG